MNDIPHLPKVERLIAWAAQHGYVDAQDAARELGALTHRQMWEDQPYYTAFAWRDAPEEGGGK